MSRQNIVIVNYGMGNLLSVKRKMDKLGVDAIISSEPHDILKADKIILPGVGHFKKAMSNIQTLGQLEPLNEMVLIKKTPVLGICLGMQLMATSSEEGGLVKGLNWINGTIKRFSITDKLSFKVPHIGWNRVKSHNGSILYKGLTDEAEFYFVHAYYFSADSDENVASYSDFEETFVSSIYKENIYGVQFHPEKSHDIGEELLNNFLGV